jgi:hypothetical protein
MQARNQSLYIIHRLMPQNYLMMALHSQINLRIWVKENLKSLEFLMNKTRIQTKLWRTSKNMVTTEWTKVFHDYHMVDNQDIKE